jgi:N-dimethylarginine dimethylaminohydrolase
MNEYAPLKQVALRHPDEAFLSQTKIEAEWRNLNYAGAPDFKAACREFDAFARLLEDAGAAIEWLPASDDLTLDSLYVRDAALVSPKGLIGCAMGKPARAAEPTVNIQALSMAGQALAGSIAKGKIEGGDLVWFSLTHLAVADGYRTDPQAVEALGDLLGPSVEIEVVPLVHHKGEADVFHLMSILSPVDSDLAVVFSPLMPVPFRRRLLERGVELVEVPEEEFDPGMACNVLALAPRLCLMLEGNPETKRRLEAKGCEVLLYKGDEISRKGAGGPTCLTRPLRRE